MKFKPLSILPLLFLCSCSMNNEFSEVQPGTEEHVNMSTAEETVEVPFNGTMEPTLTSRSFPLRSRSRG